LTGSLRLVLALLLMLTPSLQETYADSLGLKVPAPLERPACFTLADSERDAAAAFHEGASARHGL